MAEEVEGDVVMLEPMLADKDNNIVNIDSNWVYPFANLEVGDVFLYNFAPFICIGAIKAFGKYCNYEVNAVSLINGTGVNFRKEDKVILIENPWKDYKAPHVPQGLYSED